MTVSRFHPGVSTASLTKNNLREELLEAVINSHKGMIDKLQFEVDENESAKQGI